MTKNIQQIQEENRKLIVKACNPKFDPERFNYLAYQVTLSKVLLALQKGERDIAAYDIYWEDENKIGLRFCDRDSLEGTEIIWDLTLETLNEQSEEVQIAINQLLTK